MNCHRHPMFVNHKDLTSDIQCSKELEERSRSLRLERFSILLLWLEA